MKFFHRKSPVESEPFSHTLTDEIKISPEAQDQLTQLIEQEEEIIGVRLFIYGGGCGGMSYGITFVEQASEYDCLLEQGDLKVYIDAVALGFLKGVEIDYQTEGLNRSLVLRNVFQSIGGAGVCSACGAAGGGGGGCA
ncbi:MAG: iron-sulfur cluster assembly accessory protein [Chromatiales bacterium]|nr:iron-sulfur cluster assembly accessory protein [Chromatiales bacterium]